MKRVSIILPCFNEEANVIPFYEALAEVFADALPQYEPELVFVDDGSSDATWAKIREIAARDPRVRGLSFSRNFGHQAALTAGLRHATGDAAVTMDCDFQDPPGVLPEMIRKWEEGRAVVYARRKARGDRLFKKYTAELYYRLLSRVSEVDIPRQVGDFRLLDRRVVRSLLQLGEHARYLRGMIAWLGFKPAFVDFERPERLHGETHYTLGKMIKLAMDGLLSFSFLPLKAGLWVGLLTIAISVSFLAYMIWDASRGVPYPLYKWLSVVMFGFVGAQFILLWVLGEYVGRIYGDVRRRPLYVIGEEAGVLSQE